MLFATSWHGAGRTDRTARWVVLWWRHSCQAPARIARELTDHAAINSPWRGLPGTPVRVSRARLTRFAIGLATRRFRRDPKTLMPTPPERHRSGASSLKSLLPDWGLLR